jgi:C4-dicarboxylate-specific signal transduction histidine kinase
MSVTGQYILEAAKKQAEGEVAVHIANIKVYQTMPAGIGEHSDVTEAVMAELDKLAAANDRLEMLEKYFSSDEQMPLFS